jgi:Ca2+-transporting ATPase
VKDIARQTGLTEQEVFAARHIHGWNELPVVVQSGPFRVLLRQFSSFLVLILFVAAVIALALGERVDAITIGLVVLLNAGLGFVQEWKAETALASLRKMLSPQAMVLRDGQEQVIPARDIVPGDILVLAPGAKVAADGLVVQSVELRVDESVLTGESVAIAKGEAESGQAVFAGTSVTAGRAEARVIATGANTEFGKIAHLTGSVGSKIHKPAKQVGSTGSPAWDCRAAGRGGCHLPWAVFRA